MAGRAADSDSGVARAFRILSSFDELHRRLTLTKVAERSRLATSTTHRILAELVKTGLVDRDADGYFTVGRRLWELGELSPISLELRETALPWLLTLYEATAENVHLAVLDGNDALYVARVVGPNSVPTMSRMGGRLPLHTTGVGKVLLAWQSEGFQASYLARKLESPTKYSVTAEKELRSQLHDIVERGYSMTHQEQTLGNISLAVPVMGPDSQLLAAVGVVTHTARSRTARLVPVLRRAADGMSTEFAKLLDRHDGIGFH